MKCIYCNHYILYDLKNGSYKCAKCKRKFSTKKLDRKKRILRDFLQGFNPTEISKKENISYASVVKEIQNIRKVMASICEKEYLKKENIEEFNEYQFNNISFLTISYGAKVYNLLLTTTPSLQSQLININSNKTIPKFWRYFEKFMKKFKGIKEENFFYYLKEAEFRFNKFEIDVIDLINF